ncbi:hypothetical protein Tco_0157226, partial [Tanacetum coccineum]
MMAISVISVSSDSFDDSVGTPAGRVIFFGTIPTTIPDTTPVITPPITQTNTTVIPTESDPSEDPSSDHIPPLPAISPFLSSADDTTDSDTPDTPPSPTHVHMMTARKRVGPLPVQQLAVRHSVDHSSSDYFSPDDSARDSSSDLPSEASSDFLSDALSDSSSRHLLSDHSSPDLSSTSAGPSRKRRRSPMTSVPALPPISGALSPVRADLIPSPNRIRDSGYLADVEVDPRETSLKDDVIVRGSNEPHLEQDIDLEIQAEIDKCFAYADALKDRGVDVRVVVKAVNRVESETGARGPVKVRVKRVTHLVMPDDIPEPTQEGSVEVIEGVQGEQGHRIVRVELAVTALTERIVELERDNRRLRVAFSDDRSVRNSYFLYFETDVMKMPNTRSGSSRTYGEIKDLIAHRVAEEIEARGMEEIEIEEMEEMEMERRKEMEMEGMEKMEIKGMEEMEMEGMEEMEMEGMEEMKMEGMEEME